MGNGTTPRELSHQQGQGRKAWAESFEPVLSELREKVRRRRPVEIARASGAAWHPDPGEFRLRCLNAEQRVTWPELVAYPMDGDAPCDANLQGLILYYLSMANGMPTAGRWISFRELPDGWLYHRAFQGYTGGTLVRELDLGAFEQAAEEVGGRREAIGDAGYAFDALPKVSVAIVYWQGDEEFPSNAQMLFDETACHYLPTDGLAVLGHRLIHNLLEATP